VDSEATLSCRPEREESAPMVVSDNLDAASTHKLQQAHASSR